MLIDLLITPVSSTTSFHCCIVTRRKRYDMTSKWYCHAHDVNVSLMVLYHYDWAHNSSLKISNVHSHPFVLDRIQCLFSEDNVTISTRPLWHFVQSLFGVHPIVCCVQNYLFYNVADSALSMQHTFVPFVCTALKFRKYKIMVFFSVQLYCWVKYFVSCVQSVLICNREIYFGGNGLQ